MTPEEAIKILNGEVYLFKGGRCNGRNKTLHELQQVVVEALEKQVPKTPIIWENKYYYSPTPNDDWGYECPCCGNQEIDYPEHHCTCGQAIDWSE